MTIGRLVVYSYWLAPDGELRFHVFRLEWVKSICCDCSKDPESGVQPSDPTDPAYEAYFLSQGAEWPGVGSNDISVAASNDVYNPR